MKSNTILDRLISIFNEFSGVRKINTNSQMCQMWSGDLPDVLTCTEPIEALEIEFGISIDEESAVELFDMRLKEAVDFISEMIKLQGGYKDQMTRDNHSIISKITPEQAFQILRELWSTDIQSRSKIIEIAEYIMG